MSNLVSLARPHPLKWLYGWCQIVDGIISVLTLSVVHTRIALKAIEYKSRRDGRTYQKKGQHNNE